MAAPSRADRSTSRPEPSPTQPADGQGAEAAVAPDEAELASRLRLAVTRLHRRLRQETTGTLTPSQSSALSSVDRLGSPTLGELALRESVQPPSMTRIVAALEGVGYVSRLPDPGDRRVVRVHLTDSGRAVLRRGRSRKDAFLAGQLHRLDPAEQEELASLTALLEQLVERVEL